MSDDIGAMTGHFLTVILALGRDVAGLAAAVLLILAVGKPPIIKRSPVGLVFRDVGRGARRLFVSPVVRARARVDGSPGWYLLVVVPGILLVTLTPWWARVPAVLLVAWVAGRTGDYDDDDDPSWWSNRNLTTAMVSANVLKPPQQGQLNLSYRGTRTNTAGTTVKVAMPQAQTLTGVLARREALAAALRVPVARLEVTQADDDPANVVTLRVGTGVVREVRASVADASRTTWTDPVRIGRDSHDKPVHLATVEANTIVAGIMGSGKTTGVSWQILGHYLLDPSTSIYALDGKGSKRDYGTARPLCTRFVSGVDENAVADTLSMLGQVFELVQARNASGDDGHPGVLLLLEEFQDVRSAADKPQRERLDDCLGRVVRMGRAVSVHVLISTQRPSVDDLPSGVRNLVSQRLALMLRNGQDAALVLGHTPTLDLPRSRGQALLTNPAGTRSVTLDRLTEDAWADLCARATALRATNTPSLPWDVAKPSQGLTEAPTALPDPLLEAVMDVLADADPAGVPAATLHAALPTWVHDLVPTPQALGTELRRHPEVERATRRTASGTGIRVWRARCRPGVDAGVDGVSTDPPVYTSTAPVRAQGGASDGAGVKGALGAGSTRP